MRILTNIFVFGAVALAQSQAAISDTGKQKVVKAETPKLKTKRPAPDPDLGLKGIKLEKVSKGSAIETAGLRAGDEVIDVNGIPIQSVEDLENIIKAYDRSRFIMIMVRRDGSIQPLQVEQKDPMAVVPAPQQ